MWEDDKMVQDCSTADSVKFAYTASDGVQMFTDDVCGCLHEMDDDVHNDVQHVSELGFWDLMDSTCMFRYGHNGPPWAPLFVTPVDQLTKTLLGTDLKFIVTSNDEKNTGRAIFEWQCLQPPPTASNTIEMAEALMTDAFSPSMAVDYGCAGRGTFDAFTQTLGQAVDEVDHAFFAWKKCIQCASNNDKTTIGAYDYDIVNDSCGEFF